MWHFLLPLLQMSWYSMSAICQLRQEIDMWVYYYVIMCQLFHLQYLPHSLSENLPKIDYLFVTSIHPIQSIASKMMTKLRKTWILHISRVEFYSDIQQSSIEKSWMLILLFYAFSLFNRFIIVNFLERLETRFLNKIYKIILWNQIYFDLLCVSWKDFPFLSFFFDQYEMICFLFNFYFFNNNKNECIQFFTFYMTKNRRQDFTFLAKNR